MSTDEVAVSRFELDAIRDEGAAITKRGVEGHRYLLYRVENPPAPQFGVYPLAINEHMATELREGGHTGRSDPNMPVIAVGIHLTD